MDIQLISKQINKGVHVTYFIFLLIFEIKRLGSGASLNATLPLTTIVGTDIILYSIVLSTSSSTS